MEYPTDTLVISPDGQTEEQSEPTRNGHAAAAPADLEAMKERYWELTFRLYHKTEQPGDKEERSELNRCIEALVQGDNPKTTMEYVKWQIEKGDLESDLKVEEA